jgi:endoglucanase
MPYKRPAGCVAQFHLGCDRVARRELPSRSARLGSTRKRRAAPTFVLDNVPRRDCGKRSSAGTIDTAEQYRRWIREIAVGVGQDNVVFVLEPDALGLLDKNENGTRCLTREKQQERLAPLWRAVKVLRQNPNAAVHLDAGHAH